MDEMIPEIENEERKGFGNKKCAKIQDSGTRNLLACHGFY
jgi:hypothetical protein